MPGNANRPRRTRGTLLLQGAAITTSTLLVWCNRASDDNTIYANPKGSTFDIPMDAAPPEPPDTTATSAPDPSATAVQPTPSGQSSALTVAGPPDAGPQDAGAPDAKPPTTKIVAPPKPPKVIYANPKGSFYEDLADEPRTEPGAVEREPRSGRGSARG